MFLLLITGAELYACEMLAIDSCETFGTPADKSTANDGDNCICCCTHIVIAQFSVVVPVNGIVALTEFQAPAPPDAQSVLVYHPPKA